MLGVRPGGIEFYRPLPQLGILPCDRGNLGGSPWLLRFITDAYFSRITVKATVGALGIFSETQFYSVHPILISGSCKRETGIQHAALISTALSASQKSKL